MNLIKFCFICFLGFITFLIVPLAAADTTVVGENNPAQDVGNVQAAVNAGGVVILQGLFNFGTSTVYILTSVEIIGENATIQNGVEPFLVWATENDDVVIRDITLVNPTYTGIAVYICRNFLAERVTIAGMSVDALNNAKDGIWASTYIFANPYFVPNTHIKKYHVIDCDIDLGNYNNNFEGGRGISVFGVGWSGEEVDIIIKGNTVRNCSRHCVLVTDIAGDALIEDNILVSGNTGYYGEFGPNGIFTNQTMGGFFNPLYESDDAQVSIINNYIEAGPESGGFLFYFGILAYTRDGLIIQNNEIKIDGGIGNITVGDFRPTSNDEVIVKQNKFTGNGMLTPLNLLYATNGVIMNNSFKNSTPVEQYVFCYGASNNTFIGNNTTDNALPYTYYFDGESANNVVRGHTGGSASVYDPDGANYLTGVTPMADAGGAGQQISQAMQELHERLSNGGVGPLKLP